jgi:hypothetical protein
MAALGLLRVVSVAHRSARLAFLDDGTFRARLLDGPSELARVVAEDAASAQGKADWFLEYEKAEKRGTKVVADLKAPPEVFEAFLKGAVRAWSGGSDEGAAYAAAYGTSVAVDGKGNTKPTALHFTAANQQFLRAIEEIRAAVTEDWARSSLFEGHAQRAGSNVRWDPGAERKWALMAEDPVSKGTQVDAPLEWLAFRALPLLPTIPVGARVITTGVSGRGNAMRFEWPIWGVPASLRTVRSLLQCGLGFTKRDRALRGVIATACSEIRRTDQGFGNFGPSVVTP